MIEFLGETFAAPFMRRALLEAVMAGVVCGVVGVHVVLRRLPFFTIAVGHAVFPGIVIAELLGIGLFIGAAGFGVVFVLAVTLIGAQRAVDDTSAIGVALAGSFALGVVLMSSQAGFTRQLSEFLVGSIVTVDRAALIGTAASGAAVLLVLALLHKEFVLGAFDPDGTAALGYRSRLLDLVLLLCVQMTVVSALPAMGTILVVALIVTPAATARLWTERVGSAMVVAAAVGAASGVIGLIMSRHWRMAAGGAITLAAGGIFLLSVLLSPRHGLAARLWRRPVLSCDAPRA